MTSHSLLSYRAARRAHLMALLLVAVVSTVKQASGVTESAPFTAYLLAIAVSALVGGFAPAAVATVAAVLLATVHPHAEAGAASRIVFALEGLGVAGLVAVLARRMRESEARVAHLEGENDGLCARLVAQDLSRRRETEAFREAALHAQAALRKEADAAQGQFEALEALTDPLVNPIAGLEPLGELLERLRSTMRADGVAVVQLGQAATRVISGAGLRHAQVRAPGAVERQ